MSAVESALHSFVKMSNCGTDTAKKEEYSSEN
jgi:hypothetical protein